MPIEPLQFGNYYHVFNRGNNGEVLFRSERNFQYFLNLYSKHISPIAETFAYCLMSNHFHFHLRVYSQEEQEVVWQANKHNGRFQLKQPSIGFRNLFIAYAKAFNNETGRTGALFERPFHRKKVETDAYFQALVVYIHRNPETHGFVKDFRDWKWSSHSTFHSTNQTQISREHVLEWFGTREAFIEAHQAPDENNFISPLLGKID